MNRAFLFLFICGASVVVARADVNGVADLDLDLTVPEIIRVYHYPCEEHTVITPDGYILSLFRIPHGRTTFWNGKVVLLQHGIMTNSIIWIMMGPGKALAYLLADEGYDVWMLNIRGSRYSKKHLSVESSSKEFWNFSFDEMAAYDIPTTIDYILKTTNQTSLYYVGHSMGTTMFFAMASSKPEYNEKVKAMFAMAPVAYVTNMKSPIRYMCPFIDVVKFGAELFGHGSFDPIQSINKLFGNMCYTPLGQIMGSGSLFFLAGFDPSQMDMSLLPFYETHNNDAYSMKTMSHYCQEIAGDRFSYYDYGMEVNLKIYGTPRSPNYNIRAITTPIALFYGDNDLLTTDIDVQRLYNEIQNKIGLFLIKYKGFNHIDFVFGIDQKKLVYDKLMKLMRNI